MVATCMHCQAVIVVLLSVNLASAVRDSDYLAEHNMSKDDASDVCGGRRCILKDGRWTLDNRAWPVVSRLFKYELHEGPSCDAHRRLERQGLEEAHIVPIISAPSPSELSYLHVQMNPTRLHMLWLTRRELSVCEFPNEDATGHGLVAGKCFCNLELPSKPTFTLANLHWVPKSILAILSQLHGNSMKDVHFWPELLFLWLPSLSFVTVYAYTLWSLLKSLSKKPSIPPEHCDQEEEMQEEEKEAEQEKVKNGEEQEEERPRESENGIRSAIVILGAWKLFLSLLGRLVGSVLMFIAFQTLLAQFIMPAFRPLTTYLALGLFFLFSIHGTVHLVVASAHEELVYALLRQGYAVTPAPIAGVNAFTLVTLVCLLILGACVLCVDIRQFFLQFFFGNEEDDKVFFTAVFALAGPLWKITKEHINIQTMRCHIAECRALCNVHSLAGLFSVALSDCKAGRHSQSEVALSSGNPCFVDLGTLIEAGRSQKSIREACETFDGGSREDVRATQTSYEVQDLLWHGRGIYELTGRRWGFCKLPLLCAALAVIYITSLRQYLSYAYVVPELEVLSLQVAGSSLDFKPWVYDYAVELDMSFRVVELTMTINKQFMREVRLYDERSPMREWAPGKIERLELDGCFPHVARIEVKSAQKDVRNYTVQILPSRTVAREVILRPSSMDTMNKNDRTTRCISIANLSGSVLAIPLNSMYLAVSVKLIPYNFTVPVLPCNGSADGARGVASVSTAYCEMEDGKDKDADTKTVMSNWRSIEKDLFATRDDPDLPKTDHVRHLTEQTIKDERRRACQRTCRLRRDCLDSFPGKAGGCFFMIAPPQTSCAEVALERHQQPPLGGHTADPTIVGRLCYSENCETPAQVKNFEVAFPSIKLDMHDMDFTFVLRLALTPSHQQLDSIVEQIRVCRRPAPQVMLSQVNVTSKVTQANDAEKINIEVLNDWNRYIVKLEIKYPNSIESLLLCLAPLVPDPDAMISWNLANRSHSHGDDDAAFTTQCEENPVLSDHFTVCPQRNWAFNTKRWGSWADVGCIELDPWDPRLLQETKFDVASHQLQLPAWQTGSFEVVLKFKRSFDLWGSGQCNLRWPGYHLPSLLNDVESLVYLVNKPCTINVTEEPAVLDLQTRYGHVPVAKHQLLEPGDIVQLGCDHAIQFGAKDQCLELLLRSEEVVLQDEIRFRSYNFSFKNAVAHDLKSGNPEWLGSACNDSLPSAGVSMMLDALDTTAHVAKTTMPVVIKCILNSEEQHGRALQAVLGYAYRSSRFLEVAHDLLDSGDPTMQEALASFVIENNCMMCMRVLPARCKISQLRLEISKASGQASFSIFANVLESRNLKLLNLSITMIPKHWNFYARDMSSIAQFGAVAEKLEHLQDLHLAQASVWHVAAWMASKKQHTGLRSLSLESLDGFFGADQVKTLCQTIEEEGETLERLSLRKTDFDIKSLARELALGSAPGLRVLDLHHHSFLLKKETEALGTLVGKLPGLTELNLSSTWFHEETSISLALAKTAKHIEVIDLWHMRVDYGNHLSEAAFEDLLFAVRDAPRLRVFRLSTESFGLFSQEWTESGPMSWLMERRLQDLKSFNRVLIQGMLNASWPNIVEVPAYCPKLVNLVDFIKPGKQDKFDTFACDLKSEQADV